MIRLVFSDLRDHAVTWIGAFVIAVACGYIGGWASSIEATAAVYTNLQDLSSVVLIFSSLAAVAVLMSASNLTVSAQKRTYALWQLANVGPRCVSLVVLLQLTIVAILGAICGTLLSAATYAPLFPWVFSSYDPPSDVSIRVDLSSMPLIWIAVAAVFVVGGLRGARNAGRISPMIALRELDTKSSGMTWARTLLFLVLLIGVCVFAFSMAGAESKSVISFSLFVPILSVAMFVPIAPLAFSTLLNIWTSIVPQKHWNAWYLARHTACYSLSTSTSVETPIMVGFGLVAGIFSLNNTMGIYVLRQGMTGLNTSLDWSSTILLLGGPVLLCAIGAAVSVVMSSRSRTRDVALLVASGAKPSTLIAEAVCEAIIHVVTATLVGMVSVLVSNVIMTTAAGLPLLCGIDFGSGLIVSFAGFVLVLVATLIPTLSALSRETATVLTMQE